MTANTQPIFIGQRFTGIANVGPASVIGRGGTSTLPAASTLLVAAGGNGALIENIIAIPVADSGTIAATILRIFIRPSGTNNLLLALPEVALPLISTINATTALVTTRVPLYDVIVGDIGSQGWGIGPGDEVYAALSSQLPNGSYNVLCTGGYY